MLIPDVMLVDMEPRGGRSLGATPLDQGSAVGKDKPAEGNLSSTQQPEEPRAPRRIAAGRQGDIRLAL